MKYLLKNGTVVSGEKSEKLDVLVDGEKIVNVGKDLEAGDAEVIDVEGKLLFPGFIDGHTHFDLEVAGTVTADDFETGTRAALLGGTTLVIDYASQDKGGHTLKEGLDKWHKKADGKCSCDYSFHMSIVEWNDETEAEVQDMIDHGITSFKLYMTYPAMIVNDARKNGQEVYAETCPQYLLLEDRAYSKPDFGGAVYVCAPPIRKKEDQDCLWKALADEEIQTVATDQCIFTLAQKALGKDDFTKIPGGLPGVQTRGTLLYTYGVKTGKITQEQMCKVLCETPAKLYGVYPNKGAITAGSDADIVVLDPAKESVISAATHAYNTDNNPFEGFKLECGIDKVFLRGNLAVEEGKLVKEKLGKYIARGKKQL